VIGFSIFVERFDFVSEKHALGDVFKKSTFIDGRTLLPECSAERRPEQSVGEACITCNAEGSVVASRAWPSHPCDFSLIKIGGGALGIPGIGDCFIRVRARSVDAHSEQSREDAS
jgi:hypothetical protein